MFPHEPLDIHVQALLLNEWVDFGPIVTTTESYFEDYYTAEYTELYIGEHSVSTTIDVRRLPEQDIAITRGRSDESGDNEPGEASIVLWNNDGYLTPGDPRSPWFTTDGSGWGLNTQMRILVGGNVRFHGEVSEIIPQWPQGDLADDLTEEELLDLGSVDEGRLGYAHVHVTVSGILRRLSQRTKPLRSALHRAVTSPTRLPHIVDYWPMEDGKDSGYFASGLPTSVGALPKAFHEGWSLAADDSLWGSEALASVSSGGTAQWWARPDPARRAAAVPGWDGWVIEWNVRIPEAPTDPSSWIGMEAEVASATHARWVVKVGVDDTDLFVRLQVFDLSGVAQFTSTTLNPQDLFGGQWVTFRLQATRSGSEINWVITWSPVSPGVDSIRGGGTSDTGSLGSVVGLRFTVNNAPGGGVSTGHVILHDGIPGGWLVGPDVGWQGQTAATRYLQITGAEAIPRIISYGPAGSGLVDAASSRRMGTQESLPVLELLRECAATDNGVLVERRTVLGLQFQTRGSLYNRPVRFELDARDKSQIANPFTPITDDQTRANDVTAQRINGTEYRKVDETAVEIYDQSLSFSIYQDRAVKHYAGWWFHMGGNEGARYPQVTIDMTVCGDTMTTGGLSLVDAWATTADLQSRFRVVNLPPQHPNYPVVDLIIQGYTETLSAYLWTVEINASPAAPWDVAQWGIDRYTPKSCVLAETIDADDTTFDVTSSTPFVESADQPSLFPMSFRIGPDISPELVSVTAITGSGNTQTFTVTRGVEGYQRAHAAGTKCRLDSRVMAL